MQYLVIAFGVLGYRKWAVSRAVSGIFGVDFWGHIVSRAGTKKNNTPLPPFETRAHKITEYNSDYTQLLKKKIAFI
jgi:hypothetical protein